MSFSLQGPPLYVFPSEAAPSQSVDHYLCFSKWTPGLIMSPSGLVCYVGESKETYYAVMNRRVSSGTLTWEMLCPLKCNTIQVGIVKEGFELAKLGASKEKILISLNTSTPRLITLELDMDAKTLRVFMNHHLKEKKTVAVPEGAWYPLVEIREQGNILAINPAIGTHVHKQPERVALAAPSLRELSQLIEPTTNYICKPFNKNLLIIEKNLIKLFMPNSNNQFEPHMFYNTLQPQPSSTGVVSVHLNADIFYELLEYHVKSICRTLDRTRLDLSAEHWAAFQECERVHLGPRVIIRGPYVPLSATLKALVEYYMAKLDPKVFPQLIEVLQADEQLYALGLEPCVGNSRVFSTFGRMSFFIDSVSPVEPLLLAHSGLIQLPGTKHLRSYLAPENVMVPLLPPGTQDQIARILPNHPLVRVGAFFNIPLHSTINALPAQQLPGTDYVFAETASPHYIAAYHPESGAAVLYNAELSLLGVGKLDLRALIKENHLTENRKVARLGKVPGEPKLESGESGLFNLFEGAPEEKPSPASSKSSVEETVKPDPNLLEQLYGMGFSLDIVKEALIQTNNAGLEQAMEVLLVLQSKQQPPASAPQKKLKMQWNCPVCTFWNNDQAGVCSMCETAPPETAYAEEEEPVEEKQEQAPQAPQSEPPSPEELKQEDVVTPGSIRSLDGLEEFLKDAGQSRIDQVLSFPSKLPLTPFLVAVSFNSLQKSSNPNVKPTLLVSQLAVPFPYLAQFYIVEKDKSVFNVLRNTLTTEPESVNLLDKLFIRDEECRKIVLSRAPLFGSRAYQLSQVGQQSVQFDSPIIKTFLIGDTLGVLTEGTLHVFAFEPVPIDDLYTTFKLKEVNNYPTELNSRYILEHRGTVYAATATDIVKLQFVDGKFITEVVRPLPGPVSSFSSDGELIHYASGEKYQWSPDARPAIKQQVLEQTSSEVDITKLSAQEISSLATLTEQEPIYFSSDSLASSIQYPNEPFYQSHLYRSKEATLRLHEESPISSLEIEFTIDQLPHSVSSEMMSLSIQGESVHLPLQIFDFTGSQFNNLTIISKVLFPQEENFTSNYPNPTYIFAHLHGRRMQVDSVTVTSLSRASQKGFPLAAGLIFISDNPAFFDREARLNLTTKQLYTEFRNEKLRQNQPFTEADPVGFFELSETLESGVFDLDIKRPCKYILLVPTAFRKQWQAEFDKGSVEFKYFGCQGHVLEDNSEVEVSQWQRMQLTPDLMTLEVHSNGTPLNDVIQSIRPSYRKDESQTYVRLTLQHKELQNNTVRELKIRLDSKSEFWRVYASRHTKVQDSIIEKIPQANQLRDLMTNIDKYEQLNQKLVQTIQSANSTFAQRISCVGLLGALMSSNKQLIQRVYDDINFRQFILLNLQMTNQELIVQRFLQNFQQSPEFTRTMQTAVLDLLGGIYELEQPVTPQGLQFLMNLVFWLGRMNTAEVVPLLFEHLRHAAKRIYQVKQAQPLYAKLPLNRNTHAEFDQLYFSEQYTNLLKPLSIQEIDATNPLISQVQQTQTTSTTSITKQAISNEKVIRVQPKTNLPSRLLHTIQRNSQIFQVDLYASYRLDWFSMFSTNHQKHSKMRVQVYAGKSLVYDQIFGDWVMYQLGALADKFKDDQRYANNNLSELRVPLHGIVARYLTVQVTFSNAILYPMMLETSQTPSQLVFIPEFSGELLESGFDEQANATFEDVKGLTLKNISFKYGGSQLYKVLNLGTSQILDSAGMYEVCEAQVTINKSQQYHVVLEGEQKVLQQDDSETTSKVYQKYIESLQTTLKDKIVADQGAQGCDELLVGVKRLHLHMLKQSRLAPKQFGTSLDFLLTFSLQLMQILLNVDELHRSWRGQLSDAHGLHLAESVFNVFVVEEGGPVREEALKLLERVLLDNLDEKEWIKFAFALYDRLGSMPENVVTDNLLRLSFPLGETLVYASTNPASLDALVPMLINGYAELPAVQYTPEAQSVSKKRGIAREVSSIFTQKLVPPGTRRSTSSQDASRHEIQSIEPPLQTVFEIALRLAEAGKLSLAAELFLAVYAKQHIAPIKEFLVQTCIDSQQMARFITALFPDIRQSEYPKRVIQELFQPKTIQANDQQATPEQVATLKEQREALSACSRIAAFFLYRLIEELVQHVNKADPHVWLDQIGFAIDIYVVWIDTLNLQLKEGQQRKRSVRKVQDADISTFEDFVAEMNNDRQCPVCSSTTANALVGLLKKGTEYHRSTIYWVLFVKIVQRLRPTQLVEHRIFDSMFTIYLVELDDDMQQVLFVEILGLTKALTTQAHKSELNSFILGVLLDAPKTPLIRGLLTSLVPKKGKVCRINLAVTGRLLEQTAGYLHEHCQVSGRDGVIGASESLILTLQLGTLLTGILSQAEYQTETKSIKQYLLQHPNASEDSLRQLIRWAMLNGGTQCKGSPGQELLQQLIDDVNTVLTIVATTPSGRTALRYLLELHTEIERSILSNQSFSIYQRYTLVRASLAFLEQWVDTFMNSSELVRDFCLEMHGLELLLRSVGVHRYEDSLKDLVEKEVANKVTLINLANQAISFNANDWTINKKGQKARLFQIQMCGNQFEEEYPLLIKLDAPVELKHIRMGFQSYVADFTDKVFGVPSAVLVEGGADQNNLQPLGMMELVTDEAYTNFSVKVYQLNMLRGLRRVPGQVHYLKFHIRRPIVTFLEGISQMATRQYNNVHVAVSFLSVMAHEYGVLAGPLRGILETRQEDTAFKLIGYISAPKFDVLRDLATREPFVALMKANFGKLSDALPANESSVGPLLTQLCRSNVELGDWIIEQLCAFSKREVHAKLVAQIIMENPDSQESRINRLLKFILTNLEQEDIKNVVYLTLLIDSFLITLLNSAKNYQTQLVQEIPIEVAPQHIPKLVELVRKHHQLAQSKLFIKLLVTLLNLQAPYALADPSAGHLALVLQHLDPIKEPFLFQLISPLLSVSNTVVEWALVHVELWFSSLMTILEEVVRTDTSVYHYFTAFLAMTRVPVLKQRIMERDYHSHIYRLLKPEQITNGLLKPFDPSAVPLIVNFIGNCSLTDSENVRKLASALIADLQALASTVDMTFVERVLMPLLNFEARSDVCISVWDSDSYRYVTDIKYLQHKFTQQVEVLAPAVPSPVSFLAGLNSSILSDPNHLSQLNSTIQSGAQGTPKWTADSKWSLALQWSVDSNNEFGPKVLESLKKAPYLIMLQGHNTYNEKSCLVGYYGTTALGEGVQHGPEKHYEIAQSNDSFYFTYETQTLHYQANLPEFTCPTGKVIEGPGGVYIVLSRKEVDLINVSFSNEQSTYVEFNSYDNKPMEVGAPEDYYISDFSFQSGEIWVLETPKAGPLNLSAPYLFQQASGGSTVTNFGYGQLSTPLLPAEYVANDSVSSYFVSTPVYRVPQSATVQEISAIIHVAGLGLKQNPSIELTPNEPLRDSLVHLEVDGIKLLQQLVPRTEPPTLKYSSELVVFQVFQSLDGIKQIIGTARSSIARWSNTERAKVWGQYIEELHAFSAVPAFFSFFLKNKPSMELLFELLAGLPDKNTDKRYEDLESSAVKFIYDTLSEVFATSNDQQIRQIAIEHQLISKILDRIGLVSKEVKRQRLDVVEEEEEEVPQQIERKDSVEEPKKPQKKKGVGYGSDQTGQNQKWNTQDYINKSRSRSDQLKSLLQIVRSFLDFKWGQTQLGERLRSLILESSLLPLLESAFRSGSLLEMQKDIDLNLSFLSLTKVLASHRVLTPLLMPLSDNYVPRQIESVGQLLHQLRDVAVIFLKTVTNETDSEAKNIASQILAVSTAVQEAIDSYDQVEGEQQDYTLEKQLQEILALPLPKAYPLLLKDLRFDYISMKVNNNYDHHYASNISSAGQPSSAKLVRLAQEFADMSNSLPIEHTNSIFVRADKDRVDVMKAMVMGAKGTPYAHGAYVFDIFFDEGYPSGPPKMNLSTTGTGNVRFNPNLYACGKVCLSLLGTWRGNASENWDPKISTLLQILVSTQAIIMSEEVYFNEPGFEGEAGSEEGERKNEAYSNIVRYSNIKYAMIDAIKSPPRGFEQVIHRHFYLKKEEILHECNKWVKYAEQRQASYSGLVQDHNSNWCNEFKTSKTRYGEMLQEAVKELETLLNSLKPPAVSDLSSHRLLRPRAKVQRTKDIKEGMANIEEVDVTYEKDVAAKVLDVQDESVRDRWSRYIGVMGLEAVKAQANASVLVCGMGPLGIEVAKNIVLSGVKQLTIFDSQLTTIGDLSGQFFLGPSDIGRNRAEASLNKIQQLNYYVRVDQLVGGTLPAVEIEQFFPQFKAYNAVVFTDFVSHEVVTAWSHFCRAHGIKFIVSSVDGVFTRLLTDFGPEFVINDKNGEEIPEVMIKDITADGRVELLQGQRHLLEDGDLVLINHVEGMQGQEGKSINGNVYPVKVVNKSTLILEGVSGFTPYVRNGTAKHVKQPITVQFKPLHEVLVAVPPALDLILSQSDFMKLDNPLLLHACYETLSQYAPAANNLGDIKKFKELAAVNVAKYFSKEDIEAKTKQFDLLLTQFAMSSCAGSFAPLSAFLGGFVAQEVIKSLTNKFTPVQQIYYSDCVEVLPTIPAEADQAAFFDQLSGQGTTLRLLGPEVAAQLEQMKLFMVGCGAIGCELLKNFAMLNIGVNGAITITDPDHIETSNLNRQFLFREKHIRKSKSQTAAAAAQQMNPQLKGKIVARLDKVHEGTESVFTDQFFEQQTLVANALDNVQARRYVDRRCVTAKTPLLESGTLGPKGHVQCIIPFKTESYGSQSDPVEEGDIPYCTLKMFPEETFHCVEFARDKFGKLFTLLPKSALKILNDPTYAPTSSEELKALREVIKLLSHAPSNYADCVGWARRKFAKYFSNDISQLLYTYPLGHTTKDGKPFWTMPKRPPTAIPYNPEDELHVQFVSTLAYLRANQFGIGTNKEWRTTSQRSQTANEAATIEVAPWAPSEKKKQAINTEVAKQEEPTQQTEEAPSLSSNDKDLLMKQLAKLRESKWAIVAEEFEKDNDSNGHTDFIHAFGNLRALNYKLDPMDWLTVKIKAGRIVPALATTTAVIAGLQTIELVKMVKKIDVEFMKNAFINLAVPYVQLTEPGAAPQIKLNEQVTVTLWDRWEFKGGDRKLSDLFAHLEEKYQLIAVNVFAKGSPVFMNELLQKDIEQRDQLLATPLNELFGLEDEPNYCDVTINFVKALGEDLVKNVPMVRIYK